MINFREVIMKISFQKLKLGIPKIKIRNWDSLISGSHHEN